MNILSSFSQVLLWALLLWMAAPAAWAQVPAWQAATGSSGSGVVTATATDSNGNVYLFGEFRSETFAIGGLTFQNGDIHAPSREVFLLKWNAATNSAAWGMQSYGMGGGMYAGGLAVEGSNVYVTGQLSGGRGFGGITLASGLSSGCTYLAKVIDGGTSGSCAWAQYVTQSPAFSGQFHRGPAVAVNGASVYLAGRFGSDTRPLVTATFGTLSATSVASDDGFVAKLVDAGPTGSFTWVNTFGNTGSDIAETVAVSGSDVYVGGLFTGTVSFGSASATSAGGSDGFVAKLVDAGATSSVAWVQSVGGTANDEVRVVAASSAGVYAGGEFNGTASAGTTSMVSAGIIDGFVAKLADIDGSFAWSKSFGGPGYESVVGIARIGAAIYATGNFQGTASFGAKSLTSSGPYNIYAAKLTDAGTAGALVWAQQAGSSSSNDESYSISATQAGAYYVGGVCGSNGQFGSTTLPNAGAFFALGTDATVSSSQSGNILVEGNLYPNPAHNTATVQLPAIPGTTTATLTLLDALGRTVRTQAASPNSKAELDLTGLPAGLYAVRVQAGGSTTTRRLVVE